MSKENPYNRLKRIAHDWAIKVLHPRTRTMFAIEESSLGRGYNLTDIAERTKAADQLGYDVKIVMRDGKMIFQYVERPGNMPLEF